MTGLCSRVIAIHVKPEPIRYAQLVWLAVLFLDVSICRGTTTLGFCLVRAEADLAESSDIALLKANILSLESPTPFTCGPR